jgi:FlaA1/EpsC-like NDP-sugar epimerase
MMSWMTQSWRRWKHARSRKAGSELDLSRLLGRHAVNLDTPEIQRFLAGKRVLVTGAGGSIGSEICRQIMRFLPQRLILLEQAENALFEIDRELRGKWLGAQIIPAMADICDTRRLSSIFAEHRPQVVFHCAAHKHVPMMELNPGEAVKNNVFGTKNVADIAMEHGAAAFVMVSTDKAVNPTSVMGATKRCSELYVQSLNRHAKTRFVAVRFGNVLGSSGSVVPIFKRQIAAGGPVTVTHPEMRRYFMTIPEACGLVMQAGAIGQGGEIFVLDMGEPVKILDLAKQMILAEGLRPNRDIEVRITGIRPGEKLFEELACDNEQMRPTSHPRIRIWQLPPADAVQVRQMLQLLTTITNASREQVLLALKQVITEFQPDSIPLPKPTTLPAAPALPATLPLTEAPRSQAA